MENSSTSDYPPMDLDRRVRIVEGIALSFVLLVSLLLNITVIGIVWKHKTLHSKPANIFVANLCVSNLVMMVLVVPFSLITVFLNKHGAYSKAACQTNGFFSVVSSVCIVMTLCCISLDRYMAVTRPTRYKTIVTTRRAGYALLVVWAQAFLYASLPLFGWSKYEYNPGTLHCSPALADKCTLYVFLAFVGFFIPVLIMIVTYVRIFVVIRKLGRKVSTTRRPNTMPSVTAGLSGIVPLTSAAPVTRESKSRLGEKMLTPKNTVSQDGYTSLSLTAELSCDPTAGSPETVLANTATITTTIDKELPKLSIAEPSSSHSSNEPASTSGQRSKSRSRRITLMLRRRRAERQLPKEYKVAKIGLLLLVIFLVLWTPYLIVHSCSGNFYAPQTLFRLAMWLVYMNGVANPIVYALLNSNVKQKFKALVVNVCAACCCRRRGNRTR